LLEVITDLKNYVYPPVDLLEDYADRKVTIDREELEANKNQIVETLLSQSRTWKMI